MTLNELLAHNYEVVKRGDWIGFRVTYILQDDNTIRDWWEITRKDINKKNGFIQKHSSDDVDRGCTGSFTTDSLPQYWQRQLQWFYEVQMGIR